MTNIDRIVDYSFTILLFVIVSVAVWRHQNKPGTGESTEKKNGEP
jgi:hypothetical protein